MIHTTHIEVVVYLMRAGCATLQISQIENIAHSNPFGNGFRRLHVFGFYDP